MTKLPAIQFYPGDWLKDNISGCSLEAQGLWLRMLLVMHCAERRGYLALNGRAMTDEYIASRCGIDVATYRSILPEVVESGTPKSTSQDWGEYSEGLPYGIIFNKRMVDDQREREANAERQARHRAKEKSNGEVTVKVTEKSQRSSSSSSTSKPPPFPPPGDLGPAALDIDSWQAGQALSDMLGLGGQQKSLARDACAAVKRRKPDMRFTEIPEFVQRLWREYDSQAVHAKVSLKTFLGEVGRFMDSESWRVQSSRAGPAVDEHGGHFEGTVYVTADGKRMPGYRPAPKSKGAGA